MLRECLEAQLPALVRIEPERLAADFRVKRTVHGHEMILDARTRGKARQKIESVVSEPRARPRERFRGGRAETRCRDLARERPFVTARNPHRIELTEQSNALDGIRVVPDDVTEAHDTLDALHGDAA
jgi:hypothetical protein